MEYYFLFFIIATLALYEYSHPKVKMDKIFWTITIILIVFAATRKDIGTDYNIYTHVFDLSKESIALALVETEAFFVIPAHYFSDIHYVFLLYAIPSIFLISNVIYREKNKFFILLLFYSFAYLFYDMGIMRQGLALSLCIFSLEYVLEKRFRVFLVIILFSTLIVHRTSFVFFPVYWIANVHFTRRKFYFCLIGALALGLVFQVGMVAKILSFLPELFQKAITTINNSVYSDNSTLSLTEYRKIILSIFFFEILSPKIGNRKEKLFLNMYLIGVFLSLIMMSHLTMKSRGTYYYCIAEIFLIPMCLRYIRTRLYCNLIVLIFVSYGFLYVRNIIKENDYYEWENLPYQPYNSIIYKTK